MKYPPHLARYWQNIPPIVQESGKISPPSYKTAKLKPASNQHLFLAVRVKHSKQGKQTIFCAALPMGSSEKLKRKPNKKENP